MTTKKEGSCERCDEYGIIFLNGQRLLCWDHYCDETQQPSPAAWRAKTEQLLREYSEAVSVVNAKAKAKNKGLDPEVETDV
jgi:hypothetical protein